MISKKSPPPKVKPLQEGAMKIVTVKRFQNAMHRKIQNSETSEVHAELCVILSL